MLYKNKGLCFIVAIVLSFLIVNIDKILAIKIELLTDRVNYHSHVVSSLELFTASISFGFPIVLFLEPVFQLLIYLFSLFNFEPEFTIRLIVFLTLISFFYFLLVKAKVDLFWSIVVLLSPVVLANYVMTIRQGVASTIFLFGYFSNSKYKRNIMYILAPLTHYSFYFILPIFYLGSFVRRTNLNPKVIIGIFILASFLLSFFIISASKFLYIDKLQGYYDDQSVIKFGFGIIFWFIVLVLFFCEGAVFLKKWSFQTLVLSFYISSVSFFSPSSRILQAASILILVAGLSLTGIRNLMFKCLLVLLVSYFFLEYFLTGQFGSMIIKE
jgi:hypothetical protein